MSDSQISTIDDEVIEAPKRGKKAVAEVATLKGANHDSAMSGKYEMLTIFSGNDEGGSNAVPIGINGYLYQVPRDKPFKVPTEVVHVLREAVTTSFVNDGKGGISERSRPRYQFSAVPA